MKRFIVTGINQDDHDISDSTTLQVAESIQVVVQNTGLKGTFSSDNHFWVHAAYVGDVKVQELDPVHLAFYTLNHRSHHPWPAAEPTLKTNAEAAALYAYHNLKGRWPEAESTIFKDPKQYEMYVFFLQASADRRFVKPGMRLAEVRRLLSHNEQGILRWLKRVKISARSLTILDIFKYLNSPLIQAYLNTQPNQLHLITQEEG